MGKRQDYLSWKPYFMTVATASAMRSKDPSTQVGAVVVNKLNQIISTGYNGFPRGVDDDSFPWDNAEGDWGDLKYPYVAHAELNAIVSARADLTDCDLYVTLFPCNECTKIVLQSGIKKIYFMEDKYHDSKECVASRKMLDAAGVVYEQLPNLEINIQVTGQK
ncbi:deoxycytidylate deaminase [[Acholeplasma] multilocale]|uniref:deoxycytidylate deaminase n=1 Tax=[Acholeplasma] multilocale TaxID=264638 RepID=UPI00047EDF33|nr:dCMP deaminase family protein [[Acholeplasma] multilocale]